MKVTAVLTRLLALAVAVAMVAVGWYVRTDRRPAPAAEPVVTAVGDEPVQLLCDAALEQVCDTLAEALVGEATVRIEPAGDSYTRLSAAPEPGAEGGGAPDVWITLAPWPQMVDGARQRAGLQPLFAGDAAVPLAGSPLVLVAWEDRGPVLASDCGIETLTWACVAGSAGSSWADLGGEVGWGPLKPGMPDPASTSDGLSVLASATSEELGTTEFGTRSLSDGAYLDWLAALTDAVPDFTPSSGSPLAAMVAVGPASFDVAGATEAAAATSLAVAGRADQLEVHYPTPSVAVRAVAAPSASTAGIDAELVTVTTDALLAAGWRTGDTVPDAVTALDPPPGSSVDLSAAAGSDLPSAGAMEALRATFSDLA